MKKTEPKAIELCSSAQASLFYTFLEERTSRSLRESQGCYGEKNWKKNEPLHLLSESKSSLHPTSESGSKNFFI